jgi:hemerythrin-like domain-containing protein
MQRDPALRDLSSDHHLGLVLARRASRAAEEEDAATQASAWRELSGRFHDELEPHFRREELGLLPALNEAGQTSLVERTLAEHKIMRGLIAEDRVANLARFAELLKAHIHFEEKELFETAQEVLSPDRLAALRSENPFAEP